MGQFFHELNIPMWTSVLTFILSTGILAIARKIWKNVQRERAEDTAQIEASKALLHDRLYQGYNFYIRMHAITSSDLENMEYMYKPYMTLKGNGTCKTLHDQAKLLPIVSAAEFEKLVNEKGGRKCS